MSLPNRTKAPLPSLFGLRARALTLVLSSALISSLLGCAELGDDWGDQTTQATVVGGAMGAGLGAIIGSQTGSAGVGLAIGSLAGAGAGAAVGSALQQRDNELIARDELLERQQQRIAANQRALKQLSTSRDYAARDSSLAGQVALSERGFRSDSHAVNSGVANANPERGAFRSPAESVSPAKSTTSTSKHVNRVKEPLTETATTLSSESVSSNEFGDSSNTLPVAAASLTEREISPPEVAEQPLALDAPNLEETVEEVAAEESREIVHEQPPVTAKLNQPATGAIVSGLQPAPLRDDDCIIADNELALAAKASAPADKLFHQRKALRLCPNSAKHHVAIADTYRSLNRRSDAEYELREALRLEPGNQGAQTMLKELK